jgi:hypothetical protein
VGGFFHFHFIIVSVFVFTFQILFSDILWRIILLDMKISGCSFIYFLLFFGWFLPFLLYLRWFFAVYFVNTFRIWCKEITYI